ncbi:glycoside hydrolase family 25 protein [Bifidobacterium pseudocatenulatum]|uniref:glycoside hydrolase family 25 protein n=1 Tax=Bifidobacterium pseudocatenulatum TaxID=28026 RepID=UPI001EDA2F41|nr:glycoside hydrolase family 25 protein [Bifidobacterium pseudocatenulatum]MCG4622536.1 glycoside hydrolase family 25 protein [Bifidobacterium pseudocatenulatum]MCG4623996.1 glycoside hydrolase family 25 protein [Bifidobacterium pseudocatenulatum]MCG4629412.1 glycoside hydrolase family 25 protein [Bifidobacterium pseudocatenulatum]MCG4630928.1 glycoside hydrolase family 25 protein [Bifidobacterium pseudocatenulatum]MCG4643426.1 glycoside hydrolase family 25 protein [Bifidobacterium pseudocate
MVSPHHVVKIATALSAVALTASVAVAPAYALQDIAIEDAVAQSGSVTADNGVVMQSDDQSDDQTGDQQSQDSMPDNPNAKLPDNVSDEISDDATVISEDLAATPEGEVKNIETGEIVTDPTLVGTKDQQPDPLVKTNGESFIPVSAEDVKNAVADANVQLSKFESNEYGAHWGTYNNSKAFFDYQNNLFVQQAKGVIDVSGWQGDIDWAKAKADGVEGAIIRLGYGEGNNADKKAQRNISECKRLGIPFGIYWYSYADTPALAKEEGADVVSKLKQFGVNPSDLAYPVYYDLEKWTWEGHKPPTDPNVYNNIVNNWYSALQSAGYKNLGVYSYTSYLQGPLKHADIYAKTTWVAQYGARMGFDSFPTNSRGWQYTSSGKVNGISGNVDMNAFGNKEYESLINLLWVVRDEDIAVGASVNAPYTDLEYKWQSYNVNTGKWKTIVNWNSANWAGWSDDVGTYWLHLEVRDAASKTSVGEKTIAFAYVPGSKRINATYAGWQSKDVLLGVSSDNAQGRYKIKIYDVNKQQWVAGFNGQWAVWEKPSKGIYWTHFELYTSNGKLVETKTYAFGV